MGLTSIWFCHLRLTLRGTLVCTFVDSGFLTMQTDWKTLSLTHFKLVAFHCGLTLIRFSQLGLTLRGTLDCTFVVSGYSTTSYNANSLKDIKFDSFWTCCFPLWTYLASVLPTWADALRNTRLHLRRFWIFDRELQYKRLEDLMFDSFITYFFLLWTYLCSVLPTLASYASPEKSLLGHLSVSHLNLTATVLQPRRRVSENKLVRRSAM